MESIFNSRFYFSFLIYYLLYATPCLQAQQWSDPKNLSNLGQNACCPKVAVDLQGNAIIVWVRFDGRHLIIQATTKSYRGIWQALPENISPPDQDAYNPQIVIDPFGNAIVVWERFNENHSMIQSSMKPFGGNWQPTPDAVSDPAFNAYNPQIAVDSLGQAIVVWQSVDGCKTTIKGSTKARQGNWQSHPDKLSPSEMDAKNPQIVIDVNDTATVVWQASNELGEVIQSITREFQEDWQSVPKTLCSPALNNSHPQLCVDSLGNVTAVWNSFNGEHGIIQSSTMLYGGQWQPFPDTLSILGQNSFPPQIAADSWGNVIVVWESFDAKKKKCIQVSMKQFGAQWQNAPNVISLPDEQNLDPQIAIDSAGNAAVVWNNYKEFIHVCVSTKRLGGNWQAFPDILSAENRNGFAPQLAFDPKGGIIVLWVLQENPSFIQAVYRISKTKSD